MIRIPVVSSNLRSVGFEDASQTLEVEFNSGWLYHYFGVPRSVADGLMRASSKGTYLHLFVKSRFPYHRVR